MNRHYIIGNLTRDPTTGTTPNGHNYCQFTVAVNRRFHPENGPEAEFIRVTAWRGLGDSCAKYLKKGRKVACIGESVCRVWSGKDGDPRGQIELTANEVEFLSSMKDTERDAPPEEPAWMAGADDTLEGEENDGAIRGSSVTDTAAAPEEGQQIG